MKHDGVPPHRLPDADADPDIVLWRYADGCSVFRPIVSGSVRRGGMFVYCPPGETPDLTVDPDTLPLNPDPKATFV